jgi:hypothetical protein
MPFRSCIVTISSRNKVIWSYNSKTICVPSKLFSSPFWTACQDIAAFKLVRESLINLLGIRNTRTQPCCLWPSPLHPDPEHKSYDEITNYIFIRSFEPTVSNNLSVQRNFYRQDRQDRHFLTTLRFTNVHTMYVCDQWILFSLKCMLLVPYW